MIESDPVSTDSLTRAMAIIQASFGVEYSPEKVAVLFDLIRDDGWTEARFQLTLRWFLKNVKFPAWTIADWFTFSIKVFNYEWALNKMVNESWPASAFDRYQLPDGMIVYRPRDGQELPFPKFNTPTLCPECETRYYGAAEFHRCSTVAAE